MHGIGAILLLAIGGWLAWSALRSRYAVKIVLDQQGVRSHEGLAKARQSDVVDFLERQVEVEGRVVIMGFRAPGGKLQLKFRGKIHPGTMQQIRNFFLLNC